MSTELWAAVLGSVVLVVCGCVGSLFWSHITDLKKTADEAQVAATKAEVEGLRVAATFAADLKRVEMALYEHRLEVANRHVKREEFTPLLNEIFNKIDSLSERFDAKLEAAVRRLEGQHPTTSANSRRTAA